jgi:plasmid stability protein
MANLSIRKVDDDLVEQLRVQAARHGISMEEEVRQILKRAVKSPEKLGSLALRYFGKRNGAELELPVRVPREPLKFG